MNASVITTDSEMNDILKNGGGWVQVVFSADGEEKYCLGVDVGLQSRFKYQ